MIERRIIILIIIIIIVIVYSNTTSCLVPLIQVMLLSPLGEHCRCFFFFLDGDVHTSVWVKPASDFVVTFHSNICFLLGADGSHNTAITTWSPEARQSELQNLVSQSEIKRPGYLHRFVIVVNRTCDGSPCFCVRLYALWPEPMWFRISLHAEMLHTEADSPWMKIPIT